MKARVIAGMFFGIPIILVLILLMLMFANYLMAQAGVMYEYNVVFVYIGPNGPTLTPRTTTRSPMPCFGTRRLHFFRSRTPDIPYAIPLPWTCGNVRQVTVTSGPPGSVP